jgi:hypothetical protein
MPRPTGTLMDSDFDAALPTVSVAVTVKIDIPAADGIPEITPVEAFRLNPAGKPPEMMDHVSAPVPPAADNVCE